MHVAYAYLSANHHQCKSGHICANQESCAKCLTWSIHGSTPEHFGEAGARYDCGVCVDCRLRWKRPRGYHPNSLG